MSDHDVDWLIHRYGEHFTGPWGVVLVVCLTFAFVVGIPLLRRSKSRRYGAVKLTDKGNKE